MAHGMIITEVQTVQEVVIGALILPVEMEEDSGVMMILAVNATSRIMEVDLLGLALVVVVSDQVHIQVCMYVCSFVYILETCPFMCVCVYFPAHALVCVCVPGCCIFHKIQKKIIHVCKFGSFKSEQTSCQVSTCNYVAHFNFYLIVCKTKMFC
jgi:hypothetical protein